MDKSKVDDKIIISLERAQEHFKTAAHMIYVTFPIIEDKHFLVKIMDELYQTLNCLVKSILYYESKNKKLFVFRNARLNFKVFKKKIAPTKLDFAELTKLEQIINIRRKHKKSQMEFVRNEKLVILNQDKFEVLTIDKVREFHDSVGKLFSYFSQS